MSFEHSQTGLIATLGASPHSHRNLEDGGLLTPESFSNIYNYQTKSISYTTINSVTDGYDEDIIEGNDDFTTIYKLTYLGNITIPEFQITCYVSSKSSSADGYFNIAIFRNGVDGSMSDGYHNTAFTDNSYSVVLENLEKGEYIEIALRTDSPYHYYHRYIKFTFNSVFHSLLFKYERIRPAP